METREGQGLEVRSGPELVVSPSGTGPGADGPQPGAPRRRLLVALVTVLALALAGTLALVLVLGGDEEPVKAKAPSAGAPGAPAGLGMTVQLPDEVVAGAPADIVVRWTDGEGVFSGTTEDWGDDIGTSSLAQDQCTGAATAKKSSGDYTVTHTWAEPGTYDVLLGVTTYVCQDGSAVQEDVSKTVTVTVASP